MSVTRVSTAGELIAYLQSQPPDRKVVTSLASSAGYAVIAEAGEVMYADGDTYLTPEDLAEAMQPPNLQGWSEEDAAPDHAERVVLLSTR